MSHSILHRALFLAAAAASTTALVACSDGSAASPGQNEGAATAKGETAPQSTHLLGEGGAKLVTVFQDTLQRQPVDLEFNPDVPGQLWAVNYADNSVTVVNEAVNDGRKSENINDPASGHFMRRPPQIAFGDKGTQTWATCGDGDNGGNYFMGPSLFSSDPAIFAKPTAGGLGSHLDMLHLTSFCKGIAHEKANAYWTFNGMEGAIERYDFNAPHEPGADDHSDGNFVRYLAGEVAGLRGIPGQLQYSESEAKLYIADTGHGRVIKLDPATGTPGARVIAREPMAFARTQVGATYEEVVKAGTLQAPSGILLEGDLLFVSDTGTGVIHQYNRATGEHQAELATGIAPGGLSGMRVGPDHKLYFTDRVGHRIVRVEPGAPKAAPAAP